MTSADQWRMAKIPTSRASFWGRSPILFWTRTKSSNENRCRTPTSSTKPRPAAADPRYETLTTEMTGAIM